MNMHLGIDYGRGITNRNMETDIRYGVIPSHALAEWIDEEMEPDYGEPHCPKCSNPAISGDIPEDLDEKIQPYKNKKCCADYYCKGCLIFFDSEDAYPEEPLGWNYTGNSEIVATQSGDDHDIFVTKSPYYTFAQFCSPCAPGACYLLNPVDPNEGNKAYCFPADMFDEENPCPYPVYSVETNKCLHSPKREEENNEE